MIKDYILEHNFDIFYIAESWFNNKGDEVQIGNMKPEGFIVKHIPRIAKNRGGGIGVIHKKTYTIKKRNSTYCNFNGSYGNYNQH